MKQHRHIFAYLWVAPVTLFGHVRQYERWGILFPVLYVLASFKALFTGKRFYWDNVFEVEARKF